MSDVKRDAFSIGRMASVDSRISYSDDQAIVMEDYPKDGEGDDVSEYGRKHTDAGDDQQEHCCCIQLEKGRKKRCCLEWSDILLSLVVFAPLNIAFWQGVWDLLDLYCLPHDIYTGSWISWLLGMSVRFTFSMLEPQINRFYHKISRTSKWKGPMFKMAYNFVQGTAVVAQWRGIWNLLDEVIGFDLTPNLIGLAISTSLAILLKITSSVASPPMYILLDLRQDAFICHPRFRTKMEDNLIVFVGDHLLSTVVCDTCVIEFWAALWNIGFLAEETGYWEQALLASWLAGGLLLFLLWLLQEPAAWASIKLDTYHGVLKLVFEDSFFLLAGVGTVLYWFGLWELIIVYFLPDHEVLSAIICTFASFVLLLVTGTSSLLVDSGMYVDGEFENGDGVRLDIVYMQVLLGGKKPPIPYPDYEPDEVAIDAEEHVYEDIYDNNTIMATPM